MRIGELAAMVGVSARAVRHYHQLGVLPEPERRGNGYRDYRLRDAVALARIRRLAELGMPLADVRQVLAADRRRELREVLAELDADLARQQQDIAARRERLAALLAEGDLHADSTVSPRLAAVLAGMPPVDSDLARLDRELLVLADTAAGPADRTLLAELVRPFTEPAVMARAQELYARMDALAGAEPDDPRVAPLADDLAALIPADTAALMATGRDAPPPGGDSAAGSSGGGVRVGAGGPGADGPDESWLEALGEELTPAQSEVLRLVMVRVSARAGEAG